MLHYIYRYYYLDFELSLLLFVTNVTRIKRFHEGHSDVIIFFISGHVENCIGIIYFLLHQ